jgi:NADH-quinone oxidoreductase subunit E
MAAEHSSVLLRSDASRSEDPVVVDRIIAESRGKPGELLTVLEALQHKNEHNYLSREVLAQVAEGLGLPSSQVFSVATFYAFFNLEPQGRHTLSVCRGTACHTRGSRALLDDMKSALGVEDGGEAKGKSFVTTKDREFTIRTVACFGQCALAPVVEIDHKIQGYVNRQSLRTTIAAVGKKEARK